MRVLLSTIGSRGDVQPLVALATKLMVLGQDVRLCAPPDFREWAEELGISFVPIGPELRQTAAARPTVSGAPLTKEVLAKLAEASVAAQFTTVAAAAEGCDVIVAATALQIAARSVAEKLGIGYVFAAYCPAVLPSPHHAPPPMPIRDEGPAHPGTDNLGLWVRDSARFNATFGPALNSHRAALGLGQVDDVRSHIFGEQPWLAADPVLGPWPDPADPSVFQTGAWILPDERPLSAELKAFLDAGDPPIYFGLGSLRAPEGISHVMIEAARELGRRAIVSRGWADLSLLDDAHDCLAIGEVNQQVLFKRVAAVVHHGGAGTTTASALSGTPQVVIPQMYDQHYWAQRVLDLGIGAAHAPAMPTVESLSEALSSALASDVRAKARDTAGLMRRDGTEVAARRLTEGGGEKA